MHRKPAGLSSNVSASHLCASPQRGCQQSFLGWRWRTPLTPRRAESRSSKCAISGGPNALRAPVSPSTFPTGAISRGRSQPWTPALSPRVTCPPPLQPSTPSSSCSQEVPPRPGTTGIKRTCPSHTACNFRNYSQLTGSQEAGVFWGFNELRSAATPSYASGLALCGGWQRVQDSPGPCRLSSTAPGAAHSPGRTGWPRLPGLRRGPEQAP